MGNEFWAAIAGAAVGGAIAFLIQIVVLVAAARQRSKEKIERNRALAHSLLFKMIKVHSNLYAFSQHIEERFAQAEADKFDGEPWQFYLPLANLPPHMNFSTDEMSMLLSLKEDDLFNNLVSMDEVNNAVINTFETLDRRRHELTSALPTEMEGSKGESLLTREQMLLLRPKMGTIRLTYHGTRCITCNALRTLRFR